MARIPVPSKKPFTILQEDLQVIIDVDDSRGRSVPINMNFIEEGYLTKDTGYELFGAAETELCHSLYNFKKKDGTNYILRGKGTKLQAYNYKRVVTADNTTDVMTSSAHGYADTTQIVFNTTGVMPTGLVAGTVYFVRDSTANTFKVAATSGGTAINFTTNGTGTLYFRRLTAVWEDLAPTYTANAEFGLISYNDELWGGNGVEDYFKWDGTTFTTYSGAPKGNVLEVFEDRMFVSGVTAEPLSVYYSDTGAPQTFAAPSVLKPLGTDYVKTLENYYGTLLIFKKESIWKLTFIYDSVVSLFVPKLELQSNNYGACSRKAVSWVENDIWFFTGREIRAIGFQENQFGVFGVNASVLSGNIKDTLATISTDNYAKVACFYTNRRFYLAVPLASSTANTVFVCHLLYKKAWTKYVLRKKSAVNDFLEIDGSIYTTVTDGTYGVIKWTASLNDVATAIPSEVFFQRLEDQEFNEFRLFRYLDLDFKDLTATVTATIRAEASDLVSTKITAFSVGNIIEDENSTLAEVTVGQQLIGDGFGETVTVSPFIKKRISFLSKNQAILVGLSNANLNETFTIAKFALKGFQQPSKMFSASKIISVG